MMKEMKKRTWKWCKKKEKEKEKFSKMEKIEEENNKLKRHRGNTIKPFRGNFI